MLYGAKRDKLTKYEGQGLFDEELKLAQDEKKKAVEEFKQEAVKRRKRRKKESSRPSSYQYAGLSEEWRTVYPEENGLYRMVTIRWRVYIQIIKEQGVKHKTVGK